MASKPRRVPKRSKGDPWPAYVRKAAVELLTETHNATEARAKLLERFTFAGTPPARTTLVGWARKAGIELNAGPTGSRDVSAATEARLRRLAELRDRLSESLLSKLSLPAAEAIAQRLLEDSELAGPTQAARLAYLDALELERMAKADGGDVKAAQEVTKAKRKDLELLEGARLNVRDLVGVVTRGVGDHLALEGELSEEQVRSGTFIVELAIPRPDARASDESAVEVDVAADD